MLPDRRKLTFQAKGPASRTSLREFVLHGFPFATPVAGALVISDQLIPEAVYSGIKGAQAASGRRPACSYLLVYRSALPQTVCLPVQIAGSQKDN